MSITALHRRLDKIEVPQIALLRPALPQQTRPLDLSQLPEELQAQYETLTARITARLGTAIINLRQVTDEELDELERLALQIENERPD